MKRSIIIGFIFLSGSFNCPGQGSMTAGTNNTGTPADSVMTGIYKQAKVYAHNPWYEVEFSQDACGYEILINDLPVHRYYMYGSTQKQRIQINDHILQSGKQHITIRMYPPQQSDGRYSPTLTDASSFSLKIQHRATDGPVDSARQVFTFRSPVVEGTPYFLASGHKYYEFKGTFDAEVPYRLDGWGQSKDLSQEDQGVLLQEAIAVCDSFRQILIRKDVDAYASLMLDKEKELAKAFYWAQPIDSRDRWEELKEALLEQRDILPLKDFKMVLYAGGKVLALQPSAELYKDFLSAIHAQTPDKDIQVSFFLHKKAGSNKLSPIR
jgi:hypothetical protein